MEKWRALPEGPFFRSARLDCALASLSGTLIREEGKGKLLALPYDGDGPFPLAELFCFARIGEVERQKCVIYRLNGKNEPIF